MANRNVNYGAEIRKRADSADASKRAKYPCPKCGKKNVRRVSNSIWRCRSCKAEFAGGAYSLSTSIGELANRQVEAYSKKG